MILFILSTKLTPPEEIFYLIGGTIQLYQTCSQFYYYRYLYYKTYVLHYSKINMVSNDDDVYQLYSNNNIIFKNLTHLTFDDYFDQSIILPGTLTNLTLGCYYNQPLILNKKLKYLTFGSSFNQPLILNHNLEHLTFGWNFNQQYNLY